ncbi:hypothetical protein NQ317_019656 [Molorchus minor]|uniref:Uncharacterized protein n=1 Tax=Molorchus minor TaxID=1323400 RepID=A0ABQ9J0S9_9CUCU|nr:hypothetical protein NQ317_019656 [Molorchus minor]
MRTRLRYWASEGDSVRNSLTSIGIVMATHDKIPDNEDIDYFLMAYGLTDEEKQRVRDIHRECQSDPATHADEDLLKKAYNGEHVESKSIGAHILCMSKKIKFQNENGDIDKKAVRKQLSKLISDETKLDEVVEKCGVQKTTPEETAQDIMKCFHDYAGHVLHDHHH